MIIKVPSASEDPRIAEIFSVAFEFPLDRSPRTPDGPGIYRLAAYADDGQEMLAAIWFAAGSALKTGPALTASWTCSTPWPPITGC